MRDQVWSQRRKLSSRFALTVKFSQSLYESPVDLSPGKSAVSRLSLVTKTPTFWSSLVVAYEIVQWGEVQYSVIKSFGYCQVWSLHMMKSCQSRLTSSSAALGLCQGLNGPWNTCLAPPIAFLENSESWTFIKMGLLFVLCAGVSVL